MQEIGFARNFCIYAVPYLTLPLRYDAPLLCVAIAFASALLVNKAGASLVVFRASQPLGRI